MAWRKTLLITAAMAVVVVVGALLPATASAANYKVGDDSGWALGVNYQAWVSGKTFHVGDTLEFVYSTAANHSVVWRDVESYKGCTVATNAPKLTSGHDFLTLGSAGEFFFLCGVEWHCVAGMKFMVDVQ